MLKPLTKEQTELILKTAAEEFANGGFAHTSISAIARKVARTFNGKLDRKKYTLNIK